MKPGISEELKKEHKRNYQKKYYREWYAKNGRFRAVDYMEAIREWQKNHPEAMEARQLVRYHLTKAKKIRLVKPLLCSKCNRQTKLSAHHEDYSKPLEVLWLCSSCHKLLHIEKDS